MTKSEMTESVLGRVALGGPKPAEPAAGMVHLIIRVSPMSNGRVAGTACKARLPAGRRAESRDCQAGIIRLLAWQFKELPRGRVERGP